MTRVNCCCIAVTVTQIELKILKRNFAFYFALRTAMISTMGSLIVIHEYYGRFVSMGFPQILGIAYSNEVVVAVFSDRILDYRIIGQCYGGDYVGKIR